MNQITDLQLVILAIAWPASALARWHQRHRQYTGVWKYHYAILSVLWWLATVFMLGTCALAPFVPTNF